MAMLICGLFDGTNFTFFDSISTLRIGILSIYWQNFSFLIIIVYVILNINALRKEEPETSPEIIEKHKAIILQNEEESILKYKQKFQDLPDEELKEKISDIRFTSEAKEAARRILQERTS